MVKIANIFENNEVIKLVKDMIRIPSVNPPGKEKELGNYIANYMQSHGIETSIQEVIPGRFNVISKLKGKGIAPAVVFTGHMDVVPVSKDEEKRWVTDPFNANIIDGFIYGRGAADMKGGLGAAMVAMTTLAKNEIEPPSDIIFVATIDEEDIMRGAKALLRTSYINGAAKVIVCEPTNMQIVTACRGRTWAEISIEGRTAHASRQGAGINAIDRARILMNEISRYQIPHKTHNILGNSFWQVTLINGGVEPAIVPDNCTLTIDARLVPGQLPKDIWEQMEILINKIKEEISDFSANIKVIEEREPWETSTNDKLVKVLETACIENSIEVKYGGFLGTTDGTIFRRAGMDIVIFGPGDLGIVHKENERISIKELVKATKIYLFTMLNWKG